MNKDTLIKISENIYEIPKQGNMIVTGKIFISQKLLSQIDDDSINQVKNVASLPGIVGKSLAMPDIHKGYGFPIGGVAAFDSINGIITPGGIGFDINCGLRLLTSDMTKEQVLPKIDELLKYFLKFIDVGVASTSKISLDEKELSNVLENGVKWAIDKGYGIKEDIEFCEENGHMYGANSKNVSQKAKGRGRNQLGTLGAGNHFIEVQCVEEIYDKNTAKQFGINDIGQIVVMIHSGSRGLGHQVASDYLRKIEETYPHIIEKLPEKDLAYAPINSEIGQDYLGAMRAAANFAWTNRQVMTHYIRNSFEIVFGKENLKLMYDVSHNIAKFEKHIIDGKKIELCVHRKGATRSFGPNREELPLKYRKIGQPVILPGSMGTNSYILAGTQKAMDESFGSCAHGAGRALSRHAALKNFDGKQIISELKNNKIIVKGTSYKGAAEESPDAYKDVSEIVKVINDAGLAKLIAKLKPIGVIKG